MDVPSDFHDKPPFCAACGVHTNDMMLLRVPSSVHPDECLILCSECTDFAVEVCNDITELCWDTEDERRRP